MGYFFFTLISAKREVHDTCIVFEELVHTSILQAKLRCTEWLLGRGKGTPNGNGIYKNSKEHRSYFCSDMKLDNSVSVVL